MWLVPDVPFGTFRVGGAVRDRAMALMSGSLGEQSSCAEGRWRWRIGCEAKKVLGVSAWCSESSVNDDDWRGDEMTSIMVTDSRVKSVGEGWPQWCFDITL